MNQNDRDKIAIATVLRQMGECSYQDVSLRAGEGLASPLMEMVRDGEVERTDATNGRPALYRIGMRLKTRGGTAYAMPDVPIHPRTTITFDEEALLRAMRPPSPERLAAEERARDMNRKLATGEAKRIDESGSR